MNVGCKGCTLHGHLSMMVIYLFMSEQYILFFILLLAASARWYVSQGVYVLGKWYDAK